MMAVLILMPPKRQPYVCSFGFGEIFWIGTAIADDTFQLVILMAICIMKQGIDVRDGAVEK